MKKYKINEIFYSIQGEGVRAGTANVFVRFSACNLKCSADDEFSGFDCDTEFASGRDYTLPDLISEIGFKDERISRNVILTGGEPSLQVDDELIDALESNGFYIAIETNGTKELPKGIDWICVSPKSAEHTIRQKSAHEVKYVRHAGQGIPKPSIEADHYLISPAFEGKKLPAENLAHAIKLCKENPQWRLSLQLHNFLGVR